MIITKFCKGCLTDHPLSAFPKSGGRTRDGLHNYCKQDRNRRFDRKIRKNPGKIHFRQGKTSPERRAREAVKNAVIHGILPKIGGRPCADCGGMPEEGKRESRHEYDHFKGYDQAHWLDVEEVCVLCHRRRDSERRQSEGIEEEAAF